MLIKGSSRVVTAGVLAGFCLAGCTTATTSPNPAATAAPSASPTAAPLVLRDYLFPPSSASLLVYDLSFTRQEPGSAPATASGTATQSVTAWTASRAALRFEFSFAMGGNVMNRVTLSTQSVNADGSLTMVQDSARDSDVATYPANLSSTTAWTMSPASGSLISAAIGQYLGLETVTVPQGTHSCLMVSTTQAQTGDGSSGMGTMWFAAGLGPVKITQMGTESTQAGVATNSLTMVLRSSTK